MIRINRILVPTDFSDCCRAALKWAVAFAGRFDAPLDVLHVWELPRYVIPEVAVHVPGEPARSLYDYASEEAEREMQRFIGAVDTQGLPINTRLEAGDPTGTIIELAQSPDYGLIVMGTHGRTGLSHLLLGSVTEKVVRRALCPVLTVRNCDEPPSMAATDS